jgi:hypothetical protein
MRGVRSVLGAPPRVYRPAGSLAAACDDVRRATGVDFVQARARAGFGRGHLLDVVLYVPGGSGGDGERQAAELFVSALLGEELFETWIGDVLTAPAARGGPLRVLNDGRQPSTFPVAELAAAVDAARKGLVSGLPALPFCELPGDGEWAMFESTPEPRPDYAAQDDIALATSRAPEMLKCFLEGRPFSSARFSRHGELFAYLKIDQRELSPAERLRARTRVEDELDPALRSKKLGSVVGNGLGLRYGYVDLALLDPPRALDELGRRGRALELPKRSWLLFCDSAYRDEWLGIWPDSPAPPRD